MPMNQNRRLTKNIGIVVPYLADPFFAEIARNIERRCIDAGFSPDAASARMATGSSRSTFSTACGRSSRRACCWRRSAAHRIATAVERFCDDVPTVLFDSNIEGVGAGLRRLGQLPVRRR